MVLSPRWKRKKIGANTKWRRSLSTLSSSEVAVAVPGQQARDPEHLIGGLLAEVEGEHEQVLDVLVAPPPHEGELAKVELLANPAVAHQQGQGSPDCLVLGEAAEGEHQRVHPSLLAPALGVVGDGQAEVEVGEGLGVTGLGLAVEVERREGQRRGRVGVELPLEPKRGDGPLALELGRIEAQIGVERAAAARLLE